MKRLETALAAGLLLLAAWAWPAGAAQFKADLTAVTHGVSHQGKIWVKGGLVRADLKHRPGVLILRPDQGALLMVLSRPAYYLALPLSEMPENLDAFSWPIAGETKRKLLKTLKVSGRVWQKYLVESVSGGKLRKFYIWRDKKLSLSVKMTTTDGRYRASLSNIEKGPQDEALFSPPPGHKKVTVSKLPGFDWLGGDKKP